MRYAPAERLLRLARHLAATRTGLTLDEMAAELEVGRRTAERLREFPDDDVPADGLVGRRGAGAALAACRGARWSALSMSARRGGGRDRDPARECEVRGETDRAALLREAFDHAARDDAAGRPAPCRDRILPR